MKKITSLLICILIIMSSMCLLASAAAEEEKTTFEYVIDGTKHTVIIDDPSVPLEKKEAIAAALVGVNEDEIMPANVWCDLFGHDFAYTTAYRIQHEIFPTDPRCVQQTYDVKYCQDCDYAEETLVSNEYISCCP